MESTESKLITAATNGDVPSVQQLMKEDVPLDAAFDAALKNRHTSIVTYMLEMESDNMDVYQHIFDVIKRNDIDMFKLLLNYVKCDDELQNTAIKYGQLDILKLLDLNVDIDSITLAATAGHTQILRYILKKTDFATKWLLESAQEALKHRQYETLGILLDATKVKSEEEYTRLERSHCY